MTRGTATVVSGRFELAPLLPRKRRDQTPRWYGGERNVGRSWKSHCTRCIGSQLVSGFGHSPLAAGSARV
jgi:hypothetical protein